MSKTWILVANACQARIYSRNGIKQELALVRGDDASGKSTKNSDLVADWSGACRGVGNWAGAKQPQSDPKQNEASHFAR